MLEQILKIERETFLWLNSCHTPFADQFMWRYSDMKTWAPLAVAFIAVYMYSNRARWKEALLVFAAITMVFILCDQFASGLCKPFFARFRPTHHPDFKDVVQTVFNYRGGKYGFISGHAANSFGFATLTALIFRRRFYIVALFAWAAVNAYSRIYLGVHFISDIVAGGIAGALIGWLVYRLYLVARKKVLKHHPETSAPSPVRGLETAVILLLVTVAAMLAIAYSLS